MSFINFAGLIHSFARHVSFTFQRFTLISVTKGKGPIFCLARTFSFIFILALFTFNQSNLSVVFANDSQGSIETVIIGETHSSNQSVETIITSTEASPSEDSVRASSSSSETASSPPAAENQIVGSSDNQNNQKKFSDALNFFGQRFGPDSSLKVNANRFVPNEIIIKFKDTAASRIDREMKIKSKSHEKMSLSPSLNERIKKHKIKRFERLYKKSNPARKNKRKHTTYILTLEEGQSVGEAVADFNQDPDVEFAQPNHIMVLYEEPDDPYYSSYGSWGQDYYDLWGLRPDRLNSEKSWDISKGEDIVVAVIDTGIDYTHPEFGGTGGNPLNGSIISDKIAISNFHSGRPSVSGDKVVFDFLLTDVTRLNWNIFLHDLSTGEQYQITNDPPTQHFSDTQIYADIDGDKIVWQDHKNGDEGLFNTDIYLYDLSVDTDGDGTPNYMDDDRPYPDPAERQITTNTYGQGKPKIYGDKIVWEDNRPPYSRYGWTHIYMYDLSVDTDGDGTPNYLDNDRPDPDPAESLISANPDYDLTSPAIYGDIITWQDNRNNSTVNAANYGNYDIYMYDLSVDTDGDGTPNYLDTNRPTPDPAEKQVTTAKKGQLAPAIYGDRIVYKHKTFRNPIADVYVYDISTNKHTRITPISGTITETYEYFPDIDKDIIVWGNDELNLMSYDLSVDSDGDGTPNYLDADRPNPDPAMSLLTCNGFGQYFPRIQGSQIVWEHKVSISPDVRFIKSFDLSVDTNYCALPPPAFPTSKVIDGYDFVNDDAYPLDRHGHGTHCAGTIAAVADNAIGLTGVAPRVKLMAIKGLSDSGYGTVSTLAQSILYACEYGADIISNSWGPGGRRPVDQVLEDAINDPACEGTVIIFAAGNGNDDVAYYSPANHPRTIAVSATDYLDQKASFSNFGELIDLAAPGVDVLSTRASGTDIFLPSLGSGYLPGQNFEPQFDRDALLYRASGTSMAAPHVAGVAAQILSVNPSLEPENVRNILHQSADDIGVPGFDNIYGYGRVNAYKAVEATTPSTALDIEAQITDPLSGILSNTGTVIIIGTASGTDFLHYSLEFFDKASGGNAVWTLINDDYTAIENDVLGEWDIVNFVGKYLLRLTVTSDDYEKHTIVDLQFVNNTPVFEFISNQSVVAANLLEFTISASDDDGDDLTYSASNLPSGASFDANTGIFSWTPLYSQIGSYPNVRFEASDGQASDVMYVNIEVLAPALPTFVTPVPGSTLNSSNVTFSWDPGGIETNYVLLVGSALFQSDIANSGWISNTSFEVNNIPQDGNPVFVRLFYVFDGALKSQAAIYTTEVAPPVTDTDNDGTADDQDNCTERYNPAQDDTDGDGYGNICDADYDNDGDVDYVDFEAFSFAYASDDLEKDHTEPVNGKVNFADFSYFSFAYGKPPGPSALVSESEE